MRYQILLLLHSTRQPLAYAAQLQYALTGAAVFQKFKLIEYPYLTMDYPLFSEVTQRPARKAAHLNLP